MSFASHAFHQRGGRCKVEEGDEALQCSADQVARWEAKQKQEWSEMYQKVRVQQSNLQKARTQVDKFLQHHGIRSDSFDVNVAKKSFGGLYRTYPLHLAAKERDWHMVRLLLHFGADPLQRDSRGSTASDCMGQLARAD
ncbi:KTR3 [Symbiodinium sp. CCMP2592]|nr:KTR3 [Symbiodinium sp. CCMP2592]